MTHPLGVSPQHQVDVMLSRSPGNTGFADCKPTSKGTLLARIGLVHWDVTAQSCGRSLYPSVHVSMVPPWPMCLPPSAYLQSLCMGLSGLVCLGSLLEVPLSGALQPDNAFSDAVWPFQHKAATQESTGTRCSDNWVKITKAGPHA